MADKNSSFTACCSPMACEAPRCTSTSSHTLFVYTPTHTPQFPYLLCIFFFPHVCLCPHTCSPVFTCLLYMPLRVSMQMYHVTQTWIMGVRSYVGSLWVLWQSSEWSWTPLRLSTVSRTRWVTEHVTQVHLISFRGQEVGQIHRSAPWPLS